MVSKFLIKKYFKIINWFFLHGTTVLLVYTLAMIPLLFFTYITMEHYLVKNIADHNIINSIFSNVVFWFFLPSICLLTTIVATSKILVKNYVKDRFNGEIKVSTDDEFVVFKNKNKELTMKVSKSEVKDFEKLYNEVEVVLSKRKCLSDLKQRYEGSYKVSEVKKDELVYFEDDSGKVVSFNLFLWNNLYELNKLEQQLDKKSQSYFL